MLIGKRLKQRRKELSLSGDEMARYLGVDRTTYYRYERGAITKVPGEVLQRAAIRLGVTTAWLLGLEEAPALPDGSLLPEDQELFSLYHQLTEKDRALILGEIRGILLTYTKKRQPALSG
ncbi:helix-turn-helix domain-containing protein [Megasphaera elsdenii]